MTQTLDTENAGDLVRDSRDVALVDLLDRLLAGGVVLTGDLTISLAGVDLVRVSLRAVITSIWARSGPSFLGTTHGRRAEQRPRLPGQAAG